MRRINVLVGVLGTTLATLSLAVLVPEGLWAALLGLSLGSVLVYASFTTIVEEK
jgi:hypothetical protein